MVRKQKAARVGPFEYSLQEINSETAQEWLKRAPKNRGISRPHVDRLKLAIVEQRWELSPHPVCFDERGRLVDGQHRVTAIAETDATLALVVCRGVAPPQLAVVDDSRRRSLSDRFMAYTTHASVKRLTADKQWRADRLQAVVNRMKALLDGGGPAHLAEAHRIVSHFEEEIGWAIDTWGSDALTRGASALTAATLARLAVADFGTNVRERKEVQQALDQFAERVRTGENIKARDPAFVLRSYLLKATQRSRGSARRTTSKTDTPQTMLLKILRAFQAELQMEKLSTLPTPKNGRHLIEWFVGPVDELAKTLRIDHRTVVQSKLAPSEGGE